jgi:hypothetical protein
MSSRDNGDRPNLTSNTINRRNMLLAGTTLAATSALGFCRWYWKSTSTTRAVWATAKHYRHYGR